MDRLENHLAPVSHQILEENVQESQIYASKETIFRLSVGLHVRQAPEMFENKLSLSNKLNSFPLKSSKYKIE